MKQKIILLFVFMFLLGARHSNAADEQDALRDELEAAKRSLQKSEEEKARNTCHFVVAGSALLLLAIAGGTFYFLNRKKRGIQDSVARQLLIHEEKERERISRKLHDSIGQNILFIRNQMIKTGQTDLIDSVDQTIQEIRNISRDLYPSQLEKYGLVAAIDALADKAAENSGIFISHDLEALSENMEGETKINFYRIIQECISNSLKHSEATALRISSQLLNGNIKLTVQDNGKGFDKSVIIQRPQRSMGILNIEERVKYLGGKFELKTSPGNGTKYTFLIPAKTKL